jgi:plasmid stabilization system protein ParE
MIVDFEARKELVAAAIWYDEQREGLGAEFLNAIDEVLAAIAESPSSFPREAYDERARRALVPRFPYAVVFLTRETDIRVVAVMHAKRLPGYWAYRM